MPSSGTRPPRGAKECGVENCGQYTTKGKPYCFDHMDLLQRADDLMAEVEVRRRETEAVLGAGAEGWRFVNIDGSIAREILETVRLFGAQPLSKLAKHVALKRDIVMPYVQALVERGLLRVTRAYTGGRSITDVVSSVEAS